LSFFGQTTVLSVPVGPSNAELPKIQRGPSFLDRSSIAIVIELANQCIFNNVVVIDCLDNEDYWDLLQNYGTKVSFSCVACDLEIRGKGCPRPKPGDLRCYRVAAAC